MANEKNLKPIRTESEAREKGHNGGIASGKARREKKTIQNILESYLDKDIKTNKGLVSLAEKVGLSGKDSMKELVTAVCIMNTLKKGDVDKLAKLCELLGEDNETANLEDISEAEDDVFGND